MINTNKSINENSILTEGKLKEMQEPNAKIMHHANHVFHNRSDCRSFRQNDSNGGLPGLIIYSPIGIARPEVDGIRPGMRKKYSMLAERTALDSLFQHV